VPEQDGASIGNDATAIDASGGPDASGPVDATLDAGAMGDADATVESDAGLDANVSLEAGADATPIEAGPPSCLNGISRSACNPDGGWCVLSGVCTATYGYVWGTSASDIWASTDGTPSAEIDHFDGVRWNDTWYPASEEPYLAPSWGTSPTCGRGAVRLPRWVTGK
jgi:hypothetical protein